MSTLKVRVHDDVPVLQKYKVLVLGGPNVGKTSIFQRLMGNEFESTRPHIGVNIGLKSLELEGGPTIVIELWDVPSLPTLAKGDQTKYFEDCHAVIFVSSKTDATSLAHAQAYHAALATKYPGDNDLRLGVPAVHFKTKCDCPTEELPTEETLSWLKCTKMDSFDVSAKVNRGLQVALKLLLVLVLPPNAAFDES
ncbi:hypothetical protein ACHHYP_07221 [Achlya hypogyna]|uniref:Uncharacterized protein n=1 Tax=Achlya hypogyna TaxID=1202772 RepID=A0A1V9ZML4_ACHHY|nr:hypothetical protein ACHHYP_07221 [Achlya hypogyna]